MPVEIKELVIRAVVDTGIGQHPRRTEENASEGDQALVEACVKEVLRILKRAEER